MGHRFNEVASTAAASLLLTIAPANAADKASAVLDAPASHVASVDSSVAVRTEMESLIPEGLKPKFYLPLSPDSKQTIAFFYQGFKEKVGDKASLSALLGKAVALLVARETNNKSAEEMKQSIQESEKTGKDAKLSRIAPIDSPIFAISVILPSTDNSPYSQAFATIQKEVEAKYAEAKALQAVINSKDPEAVKAAKRNLEAAQRVLEDSKVRLATSQATLQTLQAINQRVIKK